MLKSPADDVSRELRSVKRKSKQKIEDTVRLEQEETAVAEDGTLPIPDDEAAQDVKSDDDITTERVKRLRRKKRSKEVQEGTGEFQDSTREHMVELILSLPNPKFQTNEFSAAGQDFLKLSFKFVHPMSVLYSHSNEIHG